MMRISPETQEWLKILTPVVAAVAALARVIPSIVLATRKRRRLRNAPHRNLRVTNLSCPPPWRYVATPADWDNEDTRRNYRRKERRSLWFFLILCGLLAIFYAGVLAADFTHWLGRDGSGLVAGPSAIMFAWIAVTQGVYLRRINGSRALALRLYGSSGQVTVSGDQKEVVQYCLGVLHSIGCQIIECNEIAPQAPDEPMVKITASTGFFPPKWMSLGLLSLISFRGEKVVTTVETLKDGSCKIVIASENFDPGVDEGMRANQRNVQRFVEAWAFFPDHLMVEAVSS